MSLYHSTTKILYVDSTFRTTGTHSDFSFTFNDTNLSNYNKCCILQASIPKSFYNFTTGSNTFILQENDVNYLVTVTQGSYNSINICTVLSTLLTSVSGNGFVYTVTRDSVSVGSTGKLFYSVSNNGLIQPKLIFSDACYIQLGFEPNSTNNFIANNLQSVNCISLSPVNRLYIKSSMCSTSTNSILQECLQTTADSSFLYFQQFDIQANSKDLTVQGNSLRFTVTDRNNNVINTQGLNIMFSIFVYQRDNTSELQKEMLKINANENLLRYS